MKGKRGKTVKMTVTMWESDLNVNHITYLRGKRERVFITTHVAIETAQG